MKWRTKFMIFAMMIYDQVQVLMVMHLLVVMLHLVLFTEDDAKGGTKRVAVPPMTIDERR
jgi:hypothetical protein